MLSFGRSQEETVKSTSDHCHLLVELKQIDAQMIKDMRTLLQRECFHPLSSEDLVAAYITTDRFLVLGAEEDPEYLQKLFKPWTEDTVIGSVFANANTAFREEYVPTKIPWDSDRPRSCASVPAGRPTPTTASFGSPTTTIRSRATRNSSMSSG